MSYRTPLAIGLTLTLACGLTAQQQREPHDPMKGMDSNGRIPEGQRPPDIEHPDRWRYYPEGRIMPGSVFERFLVSSFFSPIIFREPDIGFGGGIAITDVDFRNTRRQEFANILLTASVEGQQAYRINWRRWLNHRDLRDDNGELAGVIQDERSFVHVNAGYSRTLTRRFFGLGDQTRTGDETSYTDQVYEVEVFHQRALPQAADDTIVRFGFEYEHHNLSRGRVSGVPSTNDRFPGLFGFGDDRDLAWGWTELWYDTRDSLHNPYEGFSIGAFARGAVQTSGATGGIFGAAGSAVFSLPGIFHDGADGDEENPPTDTIAVGASTATSSGELPFYSLPSLGGGRTLRGYINNRWTGESMWHASVEYRFWVIPRGFAITDTVRFERIGLALFYDIGSVARKDWTRLFHSDVKQSYGFSLRVMLERSALFRADVGFSDEDTNFVIAFGLPF